MDSVFYVTNTLANAGFLYAHPRWHSEPVNLHVFDYTEADGGGVLRTYEGWQGGTPQHPQITRLRDNRTLSHVYDKITQIGKHEPGTVTELHFLTHGNDTYGVTMGPLGECYKATFDRELSAKRPEFRDAFSAKALVKLWGCGVSRGALSTTTESYWKVSDPKRRLGIQVKVETAIRNMYALRLSELLNLTVWATPPGWSSAMDLPTEGTYDGHWDPDRGPAMERRWWRVAPSFTAKGGARFYREILHAEIDPVGYVGIQREMSLAPPPAGKQAAAEPPDPTAYPDQ